MQNVFDGLVAVGDGGDDGGILAAGLGEEIERRIVIQHREGSLGAAGKNDGADLRMIDELAAFLAAGAGNKLERLLGNPGPPEAFAEFPGNEHGVGSGLENNGIACSKGRRDAAAGNGDGEIPWGNDHHHALAFGLERGTFLPPLGAGTVKLEKVNCLGNFGVGFGEGFTAIGEGGTHQITARDAQFLGHATENFGTGGR